MNLKFNNMLAIAIALVSVSILVLWPRDELIPTDDFYRSRVASFEANPVKGRVLMLGDSITARGKWEDWLKGCGTVNRAIEFETTAGVLARLDEIERVGAKVSLIMLGANDISRALPFNGIVRRYRQIIERLGKTSQVIVVSTTLRPVGATDKNREISRLNKVLEAECRRGSCRYLDLNAAIAPDGFARPHYLVDGVHLSPAGYERWTEMVRGPLGCAP